MKQAPHISPRSSAARVAAVAVALCLVLALAYWASALRSRVVYQGESDFGRVWVTERADGLRSLYMGEGRARQSAVYPGRPGHLEFAYTRVAMVGLALTPSDARILFVGLGGGAMPMYVRQVLPDAHIEVVELDPLIVDLARRYFGFRPDSQLVVHTGDGRAFIEQAPSGSYDLIVLDAFSDDYIPYALTTRQFLEAVRARLTRGGVVVSNLWTASGEYAPMLATYNAVFDQVHLIDVGRGTQRVLIAGSELRPLDRSTLLEASRVLARRVDLGFNLPALVERGYERPPELNAPVLEDPFRESAVVPR
ncbi:MAG TPA: fused MFS/spermidine synthase [Longimicrobiaceae bacterium]|nr:fused MFS/spermidine synthase [Longimicrobiaceae bacterium]